MARRSGSSSKGSPQHREHCPLAKGRVWPGDSPGGWGKETEAEVTRPASTTVGARAGNGCSPAPCSVYAACRQADTGRGI
eukprot:198189-Heterocapsa_arctica.AAC.1